MYFLLYGTMIFNVSIIAITVTVYLVKDVVKLFFYCYRFMVNNDYQMGAESLQNSCFLCKITVHLKKVCYKVSLCENRQRQSC